MADLSTSIAGVRMLSPFGISSISAINWWFPAGPLQQWLDWYKRCVDAGAGFVYLPSIIPKMRDEEPVRKNHLANILTIKKKGNEGYFFCTDASRVQLTREPGLRLAETLRKAIPPEIPIISSIMVPSGELETFTELSKAMESAGVDLLEVNGGCPTEVFAHPTGEAYMGSKYGQFLGTTFGALEASVKATVDAVKIPVGVKLTPQAGFPGIMIAAEVSIKAGAKYVLTAHSPLAFAPFDIWDKGKPLYPLLGEIEVNPVSVYGGGQAIRVINNYYTASAAMFFPEADIWAGGGIMTGEHVVESIMLGAKAVQSAGVLMRGVSQIRRILKFLEKYMDQCGYKSIEDIRGLALTYVQPFDSALVENKIRGISLAARVDPSKCVGCGVCADSLCTAISMDDGLATINQDNCAACGWCIALCKEDAISFSPSHMTLGERIDRGLDYTNI